MASINPTTDRTLNATLSTQISPDEATINLKMTDHVYRIATGTDLTVEEAKTLRAELDAFISQHS